MAKDYASELLEAGNNAAPMYPHQREAAGERVERKNYADQMVIPSGEGSGKMQVPAAKKPPSFSTLHKAAWVDDPMTKLEIFAKARFPDDPNAIERYAVKDGEILFLDTDNQVYKEDLEGIGNIKEFAADVSGKSLPIAGAIGGGVAGFTSGGPVLGGAGATFGAMTGESARKLAGNLLLDEQQTPKGNAKAIATEGVLAGTGEFTGNLISKFLNRNVSRSLGRYEATGGPARKADIESKASNIGVRMFMPQSTDIPSAKAKMEFLGRYTETMDMIDGALDAQSREANAAVDRYIASMTTRDIPIQSVPGAAKTALSEAEKKRQIAAKPFYESAFEQKVVTTPEMAELMERPGFAKAMEYTIARAANEGVDLSKQDNVMLGLHWLQMSLRHMDEAMSRNPELSMKLGLDRKTVLDWRTKVLKFLEEKSDKYALARYMYAGGSEEVDRLAGGVVGDLAKATDESIEKIATNLFNPARNSPTAIRNARNQFYRYGQGEKWDRLVQYYLAQTFQSEFRRASGTRGAAGRWARNVFQNPKVKENLRSALTAKQYTQLEDMADVFQAIERVKGSGGSPTYPLQKAERDVRDEAEGALVKIGRRPWQAIWDFVSEVRMGKHADQLAKIVTTPNENASALRELKKLSPNDEQFIRVFSKVFALTPMDAEVVYEEDMPQGPARPQSQTGMSLQDLLGVSP